LVAFFAPAFFGAAFFGAAFLAATFLPATFLGAPTATPEPAAAVRGWARAGGPDRGRTCGTNAATQVREEVILLALLRDDA